MIGKGRFACVLALGVAIAALHAVSATAGGKVLRDSIHDEGAFTIESFCDVSGLDVDLQFMLDIEVHGVQKKGPNGVLYLLQHGIRTEVITNPANGHSVHSFANVIEKDQHVTDNGDGTLTILDLATRNAVLYDSSKKAIRRNGLLANIPYFTTMSAGLALADALEASALLQKRSAQVRSLQEWHSRT